MTDAVPSVRAQGHPCAFVAHSPGVRSYNSGLTRVGFHLYLATRVFNAREWRCDIVIHRIASGLQIGDIEVERVCTLDLPLSHGREQFEDARLFWHNGRIYCAYTEGLYIARPWIATQKLALLAADWSVEKTWTIAYGENSFGQEKNWQFFSHDERLYFVYSVRPHVVVQLNDDMTVARSWSTETDIAPPVRGGTPPIREGDHYVTFAHYHMNHATAARRYVANAYRFEAAAPFRITGMTDPLITASGNDPTIPNPAYPHWNPYVVFPCGALRDRSSDTWTVSAGINDSYDALFRFKALQFHDVQYAPAP